MIDVAAIRQRFSAVAPFLNERGRRVVAAAEAAAAGDGGIAAVSMASGIAASTIGRGLRELSQPEELDRVRRPGGGRQTAVAKDATLLSDLGALVEPFTRGDPQSPLRWTCKSVRRLAQELQAQGHQVGRTLVSTLLDGMGYSLQGNRKTRDGDSHPDRNAQFQHINAAANAALAERQPVISVDMAWSRDEAELAHARAAIVVASRAAGIEAPLDTVWVDLTDRDGLEASARTALRFGFQGKMCIHPEQIAVVNRVFTPSDAEIAFAERVVTAFARAEAEGSAAIQLDGKFIDYPIVYRAQRVLQRIAAIRAREGAR